MAIHDWTIVEAGIFHDFHTAWIAAIRSSLNEGVLPEGYYALAEQHAGESIADILTLHGHSEAAHGVYSPPPTGGIAVAESPPRVRTKQTLEGTLAMRRRTLSIRHVSGHRLIAMLEIVSSANKDRASSLSAFAEKAAAALEAGVHLLIIDLFPPGAHDPGGIHGAMLNYLTEASQPYDIPRDESATLASYAAGPKVESYVEHVGIGGSLPDMPLFLRSDRYVNVPLERTYLEAYRGMPAFWRNVLEGQGP